MGGREGDRERARARARERESDQDQYFDDGGYTRGLGWRIHCGVEATE